METYTIGQVAERTGFTASALRFYEKHGVVGPVGRTDAGYRLYDESSVERLQFVARAKELGCSLDEISELAELWAGPDCGPVQRRLHELVSDRIAEAERQQSELRRFTAQLSVAAGHLGGAAVDGECGPTCACVNAPAPPPPVESVPIEFGKRADPPISCTLSADDIPQRIEEWARLLDHVTARRSLDDGTTGLRLTLEPDAPLDELARLAAAEQGCCAFFSFAITIDGRGVVLEVRAPDEAADLVDTVFGASGR